MSNYKLERSAALLSYINPNIKKYKNFETKKQQNMDKITKYLKDWTTEFLRHKDIINKSIVEIKEKDNVLIVKYKEKKQTFIIEPETNSFSKIIELSEKGEYVSLICLNTRENLNNLIKYWEKLAKSPKISIYFVNPESNFDRKWIIFPHTHNMISDQDSLKTGLEALFANVEEFRGLS